MNNTQRRNDSQNGLEDGCIPKFPKSSRTRHLWGQCIHQHWKKTDVSYQWMLLKTSCKSQISWTIHYKLIVQETWCLPPTRNLGIGNIPAMELCTESWDFCAGNVGFMTIPILGNSPIKLRYPFWKCRIHDNSNTRKLPCKMKFAIWKLRICDISNSRELS